MDDITRHFIATSKSLRYLMHYEESAEDTETQGSQSQKEGGHEANMNEFESGEETSKTEMESHLAELKKRLTESMHDPKFILEVFGFVVLAIYAGYTIAMYYANRDAADAAKRAADTAYNALVIGQRPWIKIKHRIISPLNFDFVGAAGPSATMTVEDTLENVGNTVALNVDSWEDVIPVDPDFSTTTARKRRDEWCNANKLFDPKSPTVLNGAIMFPKDPLVKASHMGPLMSTVNKAVEANTEPLKQFVSKVVPNTLLGKVQFVLVGCVVYRSSFEPYGTRPHMTGFLYHLGEPEGVGIQPFVTPKGVAKKLQLMNFSDGDFAY